MHFVPSAGCPNRVWNGIFGAGDRRAKTGSGDDVSGQRPEIRRDHSREMAAKAALLRVGSLALVSEDWVVGAPGLPEANEINRCDSETAAQNPAKIPAIPKKCRTFAILFQPVVERDNGMWSLGYAPGPFPTRRFAEAIAAQTRRAA